MTGFAPADASRSEVIVAASGEDGPPPPATPAVSFDTQMVARLVALMQTDPGLAALLAAPTIAAPTMAPTACEVRFGDGPVRRRDLMSHTTAPAPVSSEDLGSAMPPPPRAEVTHASTELLVDGTAGTSVSAAGHQVDLVSL